MWNSSCRPSFSGGGRSDTSIGLGSAYLGDVQPARLDAHVRHVLPYGGALDQPDRGVRLVHVPHRQVQGKIQQRRRRLLVHLRQ